MKKVVKTLFLTAMLMGIGTAAQSQTYLRHSIFLNGNIPTGDFASSASANSATPNGVPLTITQIGKDASIGFGLGYRANYHFNVGVGQVAPFLGIDFLWNTLGGGWSEKYSDSYMSTPTYFNIPILFGVSYIYDQLPWPSIRAFGEFGLGTDFLWITSEGKGDVEDGERYYYKGGFAFSFMLGAGCYFGEHVSAGLYYYGLGTHEIDYTQATEKQHSMAGIGRQRRSVGSVMLRIGFHF